jgi:hypothetical protein
MEKVEVSGFNGTDYQEVRIVVGKQVQYFAVVSSHRFLYHKTQSHKITLSPTQRPQLNDDKNVRRLTYVEKNVNLKHARPLIHGRTDSLYLHL